MKNSLSVISLLVLLIVLFPACNNKKEIEAKENIENNKERTDVINDYLPLTVGAKYKYSYSSSYGYVDGSSVQKGECIWTFISKSDNEPFVYQVEQSFNGYSVYRGYYTEKKDSTLIENQISTVNFEVINAAQVAFNFSVPYWGETKVTFERFIRSDKVDTCFTLNSIINRGCLRKNVGITYLFYHSGGNHSSLIEYLS